MLDCQRKSSIEDCFVKAPQREINLEWVLCSVCHVFFMQYTFTLITAFGFISNMAMRGWRKGATEMLMAADHGRGCDEL